MWEGDVVLRKRASGARERLIDATIELIDLHGGASGVTLREIAQVVGCSSPNVYNYFSGLDELLTVALVRICDDFQSRIRQDIPADAGPEETLLAAFRGYIEFAVDHPGRLNAYHFERLTSAIGEEAEDSGQAVAQSMAGLLSLGTELPDDVVAEITVMLHHYLVGRLSGHITGRTQVSDRDALVAELVATTRRIFDALRTGLVRP